MTVFLLCMTCALDMTGYIETRPYVLWGDSTRTTGLNRAWVEGKAAYRLYGGQMGVSMVVPYDTIAPVVAPRESIAITRAAVWFGPEQARLVIGKQRFTLGVGRVFRPLDVFDAVNYFEPGYERSGVNAVVGSYGFDPVTNVRAIYTPGYDWEHATVGLNLKTTLVHHDVGIIVVHRPLEPYTLAGGEIAGELFVGYWGEFALVQDDRIDYSTYVAGVDYSFPLHLYAMIEYYFDGSGVDDPARYDFDDIITGRRQTLAQHYLYGTLSTIPLPFDVIRPAINALVNCDDEGVILIPTVSIVPYDNIDITVGMNVFFGPDDGEFTNITAFDGAAYIWLKVFF